MRAIRVKKGKDLLMPGEAEKRIEQAGLPQTAAIQPRDFYGLRPRLLVSEGDPVQIGTPVIADKNDDRIKIVSPVQGRVAEIRRAEKRALTAVVITLDERQDSVPYTRFHRSQIPQLSRQQIIDHLLETGSWPFIRQRPFDRIAHPDVRPGAVFVKAMDTNPLALDIDYALREQSADFQAGLEVLARLTDGTLYLCISKKTEDPFLTSAQNAEVCVFDGPHPAGNVGTHISALHPVGPGSDAVWHIDAQDTAAIGRAFLTGHFSPGRIVAVAGEKAEHRVYQKVVRGAAVKDVIGQVSDDGGRIISGSVLSGQEAGADGFVGFYDTQVCVIPRGGKREFLGWTMPGRRKYSFSRAFLSAFRKPRLFNLDSSLHGSPRSIVLNDRYDQFVALDVLTFFLIRAILAGEVEEMERLGILECAPEDFALAAFVCPSKTDICGIIRQGLDLLWVEGLSEQRREQTGGAS